MVGLNETEIRIAYEPKRTPLEKYINSKIADNIEILIIKEDYFMLDQLKKMRDEYVAELENLKNATDLEAIKNARFELIKETIAKEVEDEFNAKLAEIELNISHFDFVIAKEEEKLAKAAEEEMIVEENMEE